MKHSCKTCKNLRCSKTQRLVANSVLDSSRSLIDCKRRGAFTAGVYTHVCPDFELAPEWLKPHFQNLVDRFSDEPASKWLRTSPSDYIAAAARGLRYIGPEEAFLHSFLSSIFSSSADWFIGNPLVHTTDFLFDCNCSLELLNATESNKVYRIGFNCECLELLGAIAEMMEENGFRPVTLDGVHWASRYDRKTKWHPWGSERPPRNPNALAKMFPNLRIHE